MQRCNGFSSKNEYLQVLEKAVESGLTGLVVYDNNGRFVFCNKTLEILTGTPREILELSSAEELQEREEQGISSTFMVLEKNEEVLVEQHMVHNGKTFIVKGIPFYDGAGNIKYVISNIVDVSRLRDLKRKLDQKNGTSGSGRIIEAGTYDRDDIQEKLMIYNSRVMQNVMEKIIMLKNSSATVLLQGESGTGKEVVAKVLHDISDRKDRKYIRINCGAIPEALFESELFGYMPGSFTGGEAKGKTGLIEHAHRGTVLLDEISEIPLRVQSKILRVLQEGEVQKIGSTEPVHVDVRFIAATNVDLLKLVEEGKFRKDLYYRLNVIPITLPPLRERTEDIPPLIFHFLQKLNRKYGLQKTISNDVITWMQRMEFQGNIRELENFLERLLFFSKSFEISTDDVRTMIVRNDTETPAGIIPEADTIEVGMDYHSLMNMYEKKMLEQYRRRFKTTRKIAEALGIDQSSVSRKLRKFQI